MKNSIILLLSIVAISAFGQIHSSNGMKSSGTNSQDLTDEQRHLSNTFVHDRKGQRIINEECALMGFEGDTTALAKEYKDDPQAFQKKYPEQYAKGAGICGGGIQADGKILGKEVSEGMINAITKAYTMVIGSGITGGFAMKKVDPKAKKDAPEEKKDYCQYVAVGTETLAMFNQKSSQNHISSIPIPEETAQKSSLKRIARSHKDRASNSKIQATGWGVTTGCYTAMMAQSAMTGGGIATGFKDGWKNYLKLGASALLWKYFKTQKKEYDSYHDQTMALANKLPGKGDCNPVTDNDCYCSEETTKNDPQYCMPYLHNKNITSNDQVRAACLTNRVTADPKCGCQRTNSCLNHGFTKLYEMNMLPPSFDTALFKDIGNLSNGTIGNGQLSASDTRATSAINKALRFANQKASKLPGINSKMSPKQKQAAKQFESLGAPKMLAKALSLSKLTPSQKKAYASFGNRFKGHSYKRPKFSRGSSSPRMVGGSGIKARKSRSASSSMNNPFSKFGSKKKRRSNDDVLRFAQRAAESAEINNRKEDSIFKIISRRYLMSGQRRLELK